MWGWEVTRDNISEEQAELPLQHWRSKVLQALGTVTHSTTEVSVSCHHLLLGLCLNLPELFRSGPSVYLPSIQVLISLNCWEQKIAWFPAQAGPGFLEMFILTNGMEQLLSAATHWRKAAQRGSNVLGLGAQLASDSFCRATVTKAYWVALTIEVYCFSILEFWVWNQGINRTGSFQELWRILFTVTRIL